MHFSNMDENDSDTGSNHESDEDEGSDFNFLDDSLYSNHQAAKPITNNSAGAQKLRSWLNKTLKIKMTDGRTLVGVFLCTDRDANVILGSCSEYLPPDTAESNEDPRMLGLVMIPGKHIVSVHYMVHSDDNDKGVSKSGSTDALNYV